MRRLLVVLALAALPAFPVAKEIIQLQRDLAQLQDQIRQLQRGFDTELAKTQQLLNQNLEASGRLATALAVLERTVQGQEKTLTAPLASASSRVDTLAGQFQALRDAVEEMNSRLGRLQQQIVDIKNIVSTVPPPATAPAPTQPSQPTPPVQAETLWKNALRDYQAGNYNLAGPQFNEYLKWFGATDLAADAQYYLGEIFYQQKQYEEAVEAFDQVLEKYPEGKRTADAQYKKGLSFLKQGRRDAAAKEFREVTRKYPHSAAAAQASEALRGLGLAGARTVTKSSRRK